MNTISSIHVVGVDAFDFLQGQLTNDVSRLRTEPEILAAWCSPKGRVIWFGTISAIDSGFALSAPADTAENIVRRLSIFRFRAKVELSIADEGITVDPAFLIRNGYPYIGAEQVEKFTAHMLNLDLLDAISLTKGCYTGQEIIARTHYKGATKRRTLRFASAAAVNVGDKISDGSRDVGEVLNVAGMDLLGVVPLDKSDTPLKVKGIALTHVPLAYLSVADSAGS